MKSKELEKIMEGGWYWQGFPASPVFLNLTGYSGFIGNKLKIKYKHFLWHYRGGYGEMGYDRRDLERVWKKIKPRILADFNYLVNFKKEYLKDWQKYLDFYEELDSVNIKKISDEEIIKYLRKCAKGQVYSAGISHFFVEPISMIIEEELKRNLLKEVKNKGDIKKYLVQLSAPTKYSWAIKEELELKKISELSKDRVDLELKQHLKKYYFIRNSYRESKRLAVRDLKNRIEEIKNEKFKVEEPETVKKRKGSLIKELGLGRETRNKIKIADYMSIWQDERKANIFMAINNLDKVIKEVSRRTGINHEYLYFFSPKEILNVKSIDFIKKMKTSLIKRKKGVFYYINDKCEETTIVGKDYKKLMSLRNKTEKRKKEDSLHGSIANTGVASGRVVICKNISHIGKVKKGDILVSSMTRPEFMPAIKKAGALVTDEGGITCHAAIVARELGIPCVIGTKVATKVLKEGMMVEVRANHGVVNIIK